VLGITQAFSLCGTLDEAAALREEIAFFQAIKSVIAKSTTSDKKLAEDRKNAVLKQILYNADVSEGVEDIFKLAGLERPDIGILSDAFLDEARRLPQRKGDRRDIYYVCAGLTPQAYGTARASGVSGGSVSGHYKIGMRREAIGKPCGGSMFKGSKFNVSKQKPVPIVPALRYGPLAYSGLTEFSNSVSIVPIEGDDDSPLVNNPRNDSPECIRKIEA
jgi:hypothetical protein